MTRSHGFVNIQGRGTIALPAALRRVLHLDQPGAQVEVLERDDGIIELRPHLPVAAREAWGAYEPRRPSAAAVPVPASTSTPAPTATSGPAATPVTVATPDAPSPAKPKKAKKGK